MSLSDPPSHPILRYQHGAWQPGETAVPQERSVSLTVNGETWLSFSCTPLELDALAVGFLFNEGLITRFDEIADLKVCENGENVDVWTRRALKRPRQWLRTSGCTGGVTAGLPDVHFNLAPDQTHLTPASLLALIAQLSASQALYRQSGGLHTTILTDGAGVVAQAEDIGRHNTLDKLAGQLLLRNLDPHPRILLTTGRISSEMLLKAARLQAPIVISRTAPTHRSIELAEAWGITLVGYARQEAFTIYTHAWRLM